MPASVLNYEMNKINVDEKWREQSNAQKREIAQLRAQLAKCVDMLETYQMCFDDDFVPTLLDKLPRTAKATAEVLRCAEELYQLNVRTPLDTESTTDLVKKHVNCVKNVVDAVRAAKETRA